jgi:hypothetical protein
MQIIDKRSKTAGPILDLGRLSGTEYHRSPYPHLVVPNFVRPERLGDVADDFPSLPSRGNYLPGMSGVSHGAVRLLLEELRSPEFRDLIAERLRADLKPLHQLITLRGFSGPQDGNIHTDSEAKVVSAIIYPSVHWGRAEGSLRILSTNNIDDFVAEIAPCNGNLVAFVRGDNSYHGYLPFVGPRPIIQIHWLKGMGRYVWDKCRLGVGTWNKRASSFFDSWLAPK